jgi:flagellar M-ring protein FliF
MGEIKRLLDGLTGRQKFSILLVVGLVAGGLYGGVRWNRTRDMRALFHGLAADDAGKVLDRLRSAQVPYEVGQDGGTILVPAARVAELRMDLASAGLPRTGRIGFELFDRANFGATDFAEQVNYRRAVEGELERSIQMLAEVESARVHITFPKESVFVESRQPSKASILLKLRPAARLNQQNVLAIRHLVASAVEGLDPEAVSVLDMNGNLLGRSRRPLEDAAASSEPMLDYKQAVEKELLAKIRATLDPLLGEEKYRGGVAVECDFTSGEQSEEIFDPNASVMLSSQKTEDVSNSQSAGGGQPGTASNLPRPPAKSAANGAGVARRTENVSYQTSRTIKRTKIPQGIVRRVSVSLLLDHGVRWEGTGAQARRVLEPPPPEKLKVVRDVVAGVVGFREDRGDQILVESLPFEATLLAVPPGAGPAPASTPVQAGPAVSLEGLLRGVPLPVVAGAGVAVLVVALVAYIFLRQRRKSKRRAAPATATTAPSLPAPQHPAAALPPGAPKASIESKLTAQLAEIEAERDRQEQVMLASLNMPASTKKAEVLKKHITESANKDPVAVAQLVRAWVTEEERLH